MAEIMDAMADQLDDLISPQSYTPINFQGRAFVAVPPSVDMLVGNPTGLEQGLAGFTEHNTYGAFPITLRVRVQTADVESGEDLLLALIDDEGPLSITAALQSDDTLGGVCDQVFWSDGFPWTGYQDFDDPNGSGRLLGSTMAVIAVKPQS